MRKLKSTILVLTFFISSLSFGQTHFVGLSVSGGNSGINYENSEGTSLEYSNRLSTSWDASYAYRSKAFLAEVKLGTASLESSYSAPGLESSVAMDFLRTSVLGSYLIGSGPVKFKLGAGVSMGFLQSGLHTLNGVSEDIIENKTYNTTDLAVLGEAGLLFTPSDKVMVQFNYFYRHGLSNLETNSDQTTNTIGNGFQASVYFGF